MKSGYYSPIPDTEETETKVEEPTVAMWVAHIISLKRWTASNILCLQTHFLSQVSKVGNQKIPGVTGKFSLGVHNEEGKMLTEFCQENALVIANILFQQHKRRLHTHGHPQMVNTEIRLITVFAVEDGETLYSQQKQDWELTWLRS